MDSNITLIQGDCLVEMDKIADGSVDMALCDLPYGTTQNKWDSVIPLQQLWTQYKRVIKPNGAIVLFGSQPFTSRLIMSNEVWFRYEIIWEKSRTTGFLDANRKPLKVHENICVFYQYLPVFNPQMTPTKRQTRKHQANRAAMYGNHNAIEIDNGGKAYPQSLVYCANEGITDHPTQKPLEILRYLIRTYTNEGDTVLDNCMGSGSTLVACIEENRNGIGIEMDAHYFKVASERIQKELTKPRTMKMELA